jgi:hypothetical protein
VDSRWARTLTVPVYPLSVEASDTDGVGAAIQSGCLAGASFDHRPLNRNAYRSFSACRHPSLKPVVLHTLRDGTGPRPGPTAETGRRRHSALTGSKLFYTRHGVSPAQLLEIATSTRTGTRGINRAIPAWRHSATHSATPEASASAHWMTSSSCTASTGSAEGNLDRVRQSMHTFDPSICTPCVALGATAPSKR